MEQYKERMLELGSSMFALLTGVRLHDEQLNLIKNSTDKERNLAMQIVAYDKLEGQAYTNFCQNMRRIREKDYN